MEHCYSPDVKIAPNLENAVLVLVGLPRTLPFRTECHGSLGFFQKYNAFPIPRKRRVCRSTMLIWRINLLLGQGSRFLALQLRNFFLNRHRVENLSSLF